VSREALLRHWTVLTLTLAALSLGPSFAHILGAPPRLYDWPAHLWIDATVRHGQFVPFRDISAPLDVGAVLAAAILAFLLHGRSGFGWILAATALLVLALIAWLAIVSPANAILAGWQAGPVPADFVARRDRWEIGHMVVASLKALGFVALAAGATGTRAAIAGSQ
jgi:hypothetical protein